MNILAQLARDLHVTLEGFIFGLAAGLLFAQSVQWLVDWLGRKVEDYAIEMGWTVAQLREFKNAK